MTNYISKMTIVMSFAYLLMLPIATTYNTTIAKQKPQIAFAGDVVYHKWGGNWWAVYATYSSHKQPIIVDGTAVHGAYATYNDGIMTIDLGDNLELDTSVTSVYIQGYTYRQIRNRRLSAVRFRTYQGSDLQMEVGHYEYFVIKLKVKWVK